MGQGTFTGTSNSNRSFDLLTVSIKTFTDKCQQHYRLPTQTFLTTVNLSKGKIPFYSNERMNVIQDDNIKIDQFILLYLEKS